MANVAVVAHADKTFGGGLAELRAVLAREGYEKPLWYEFKSGGDSAKYARRALSKEADVIFIWGGDGTVQQCIDALVETKAVLAILPAGTANLLAGNLNIPNDIAEAVSIGLRGTRAQLDRKSVV